MLIAEIKIETTIGIYTGTEHSFQTYLRLRRANSGKLADWQISRLAPKRLES
jgi:hypothetical protein